MDVFCQIGLRGHLASRILMRNGFPSVRSLNGGYRLLKEIQTDKSGGPQTAEVPPWKRPRQKPGALVCFLSDPLLRVISPS